MAPVSANGAKPGGVDGRRMRALNLALVLASVIDEGSTSRARLVAETGLRKATISSLVDELMERGWLRPGEKARSGIGRPRELVLPNEDRGFIVGAEINVDYLAVLIVDFAGGHRHLVREPIGVQELGVDRSVRRLAELVVSSLDALGATPDHLLGVSLGLPGVVDADGILLKAANVGWQRVDVRGAFADALGSMLRATVPVLVENEANLGAIAEQTFGKARSTDNFVYLSGELGVGAGVIIDGDLFRGRHGAFGEVGHITLDPNGPRCACGKRGCWQVYVSQSALRHADAQQDRRALADVERHFAVGLGNLVQMYDPELILLGGIFASAFATRVERIADLMQDWVMGPFGADVRIDVSELGQDACIRGAVSSVLRWLVERTRAVPV